MLEAFESFKEPFGGRLEDRRREAREKVEDGTVEINGQTFPVFDWSARAFMARPCDIDCEITDRVDIKFSVRFPTKRIEFVSRAIVVRIDKQRQELTAYFAMLDEEAQLAIADHFGDGSMTRVAATASPPEPAPAAPQQPEARLAEERRNADSEDDEPVAPETEKQAEGGDSDADGEVLELTQMVCEDETTIDISEEPVQSDDDKATPKATGADKPKEFPPADEGPLVGGTAADASVKARAELNLAAEAAEPKPVSPAIGDQGRTIEDMVMDSLKPMLRDWLNTNLPNMVEKLVEKEIRRLVRRAEPD